jgi:hypothetical protein
MKKSYFARSNVTKTTTQRLVNSYNSRFNLGLTSQESQDLVEYLKSL